MNGTWATVITREFKKVELGDQRLNERCQQVVKSMAKQPSKSIPQACGDWGSTQAAYRFFSNEQVSRQALLEAPIECTIQRMGACREVLAIQDTTYLNFTAHKATEGLGPIGTKRGLRGLVVHSTLAVELERGEVLGLLDQQVWVRGERHPREETAQARRQRDRESQCWVRGIEALEGHKLGSVIEVMDREGDIYEVLEKLKEDHGRFVIRACRNRLLVGETDYVFDAVKRSEPIGKVAVNVPAKAGQKKRQALLSLRRVDLRVRPPKALGRQGKDLEVGVVEAREEHAPKGCVALHWVLLTGEPIDTLEACVRVTMIYTRRWKIEEFHMGLKTGCRIEDRQLGTRQRLESLLGLCSVISVMMLRLRDAARTEGSALDVLTETQLIVLRSKVRRLGPILTAREALRAVAQLGGFLGRKGDGEPGWRTLWRGMEQVLLMEHGYLLAKSILPISSVPA